VRRHLKTTPCHDGSSDGRHRARGPAHAATTGGIATAYKLTLIKAGDVAGGPTEAFGINNNGEIFGTGDLASATTDQSAFVLPAGASAATFLAQPSDAF
jgi:hypothetical protein